jgi:arsenate reductase (thioredoxin)
MTRVFFALVALMISLWVFSAPPARVTEITLRAQLEALATNYGFVISGLDQIPAGAAQRSVEGNVEDRLKALLNALGRGRFRAFSAGSHPTGRVHPLALEILEKTQLPVAGLRSKSWEEFARPGAPPLDFVFTVCDNAAGEACPAWPGQPMTAHWGIEDPAAFEGSEDEKRRYFYRTFGYLRNRVMIFTCLPFDKLDKLSLQKRLDEIGQVRVLPRFM